MSIYNLNTILYGPPGTGKTYRVVDMALEIIDAEKYGKLINNPTTRDQAMIAFNDLIANNRIAFCTFHQSYGYEEFVEGLRCEEPGSFKPKDGIFKNICNSAKTSASKPSTKYDFDSTKINFFKMSLGNTMSSQGEDVYDYCIQNDVISLGHGGDVDYSDCFKKQDIQKKLYAKYPNETPFAVDAMERFKLWMQKDDIVIVSLGNLQARAIARVTGDYFYNPDSGINYDDYKHFRKVEWLYKDVTLPVQHILKNKIFSQQTIYMFGKNDLLIDNIRSLLTSNDKNYNYVLIIDEINRGNISKIFGELITLIEQDKRLGNQNGTTVTLPYSNESFGVPNNLYIIATMNTADRSIALMDTALRRRFSFEELTPDPMLLPENIEGINVREFLRVINERIEYLYDRDHTIGHAYFIKPDLKFLNLVEIMKYKIIPLLQEYFYEDWEKIEAVLGGAGSPGDQNYFLVKQKLDARSLFTKNK